MLNGVKEIYQGGSRISMPCGGGQLAEGPRFAYSPGGKEGLGTRVPLRSNLCQTCLHVKQNIIEKI